MSIEQVLTGQTALSTVSSSSQDGSRKDFLSAKKPHYIQIDSLGVSRAKPHASAMCTSHRFYAYGKPFQGLSIHAQ
ncbi:hypothetical protein D3C85_1496820 [compost metagenome]